MATVHTVLLVLSSISWALLLISCVASVFYFVLTLYWSRVSDGAIATSEHKSAFSISMWGVSIFTVLAILFRTLAQIV